MTNPTENSQLKTPHLILALLVILYIVVALAHACLAPLTTGPDELAHYEYVNFIANHHRLPLTTAERSQASYKSDQPPLYHLIAALPAALLDPAGPPYLKRVQDHPRRQLIERTRHAWGLYNTEDEAWPYYGQVLRWQAGRWVAILFGAATVIMTFLTAREVFATFNLQSPISHPQFLALAAAAVVAFIPRFALTGSMLNYETTLAFFSALFLWILVRMAIQSSKVAGRRIAEEQGSGGAEEHTYALRPTHYAPRTTFYTLLLGLFAGLAITAKLSALILPLEIAAGLWLIGRYYGWSRQTMARRLTMAAAAAVAAVSWWFGFVLYQFNTVARDGWWTGLLRPLIAADSSDATTNQLLSFLTGGQAGFTGAIENLDSGPPWEWLTIFFRTFWVVGIEQQQPLGAWGLVVALALCLLAAVGLWQWHGPSTGSGTGTGEHNHALGNTQYASLIKLLLSLLLLHLAAAFVLPLARYAVTFSLADTAQGRHILFQTAPAFAILLIWGLSVTGKQLSADSNQPLPFVTRYALRATHYIFPLFLLLWTGVQLWTMTWAYLPPLPVHTLPRAEVNHRLNQPLNQYVTLLGFDTHYDSQNRLLRVDLLWQSTAVSPVDFLTEVTLLDPQGEPQAQWLGYPAEGRYPTRAWDVGDTVRDTIWLPTGGLHAGQYTLNLNLLAATLNPPPEDVPASLESPLTLKTVTILDSTLRIYNHNLPFTGAAQASGGYSVWQNGQPLNQPQLFRYRETVVVTLAPLQAGQQRVVQMAGPDGQLFAPARLLETAALFIVGPDWPTGDYRLQIALTTANGEEQWAGSGAVLRVIDRWERDFTEPAMSHRVEANFANQVKLLGYDLPANRAEPGGGIPLTLYWQGLDWMGQNYTIFAKLLSAADQSQHGGRDRLPREGYSTLYWAPGEIVTDPFGLPVDANAPDGVYTINLGLYKEVNGQAVSLPLAQNGQPLDATSLNIGPIKVGGPPPGATIKQANPQVQLNQPFGDAPNLTLLGYNLIDQNGQPVTHNSQLTTHNLKLTLYWRAEAILPVNYTTFVHLRNSAGENVAQKDQPPLAGAYPTSLWDPGEIIADEITLPLPAELPAGQYQLVVGLYRFDTGQRLTVPGNPANELTITQLSVMP